LRVKSYRYNLSCMPSTFVYIAYKADRPPKEVEYASAADDFERMARFAQAQETGNEGWKSWALANAGEVIIMNGDEGRIRIPAEKLTELPHLRSQYAETVGAPISIGIGAKMSEADKALQAAQKAGGDRIRLYDQSVEEDLAEGLQKNQAAFHDPRTGKVYPTGSIHDLDGLPEELQQDAIDGKVLSGFVGDDGKFFQKPKLPHLAKAEGPAYAEDAGAGFVPEQRPTTAHPLAPTPPQDADPEPSQEGSEGPPPDVAPPDMDQLHDTLGQMASQQGQQDAQDEQVQQAAQAKGQAHGDLTKRVAAILQVFKKRASELEQLQQADPELYQSLVGMLQAMTEMARSVQGEDSGAEVKKSEPTSCPMCGAEPGTDIDCPECLAYDKVEVSPEESFPEASELHKDLMPGGKGDDAPDADFNPDDLKHGVKEEREEHGLDEARAKEIVKDHLTEDDKYYKAEMPTNAPIPVQHFSAVAGLTSLDPKKQGTGAVGAERQRPNRIPRTYYYTRPGTPEGVVTAGSPHLYHGELPAGTKLYDMGGDKLGLMKPSWKQTKMGQVYNVPDLDTVEKKLVKLGYHGYHNYGVPSALAYFHSLPVKQVSNVQKAALDPGKTGRHEVKYPVGSTKEPGPGGTRDAGEVKIQKPDGSTTWRSVRAGLIQAPDGSPTSSRNPNPGGDK
jgi:hypothetical protein